VNPGAGGAAPGPVTGPRGQEDEMGYRVMKTGGSWRVLDGRSEVIATFCCFEGAVLFALTLVAAEAGEIGEA
jgi:hypothetical protein